MGYLKPWRRKIGVVTLVMACVFAGGWVRSLDVVDTVTVTVNESTFDTFCSCPLGMGWSRSQYRKLKLPPNMPRVDWATSTDLSDWNSSEKSSEVPSAPFGFRVVSEGDPQTTSVFMSHYTTSIPLTALTLWLLLTKPRKSTQMKINEPTGIKGA